MKHIQTRISLKHDTESVWLSQNPDFIPFAGEVIIFDADENNSAPRFKVGDGKLTVKDLPFAQSSEDTGSTNIRDTAEGGISFFDGQAKAEYSVANGSNDKSVVVGILGETLANKINVDVPIAEGVGSTATAAGAKTISSGGNANGVLTTTGVKGFYWDTIDFSAKKIRISSTRRTSSLISPTYVSNLASTYKWSVGDTITMVNDNQFPACAKITAISGDTITVDELPFSNILYSTTLSVYEYKSPDDRTIFACYEKEEANVSIAGITATNKRWYPRDGAIELGWSSTAFGVENLATGAASFTSGFNNHQNGNFGFTTGRNNIGGYASVVGGSDNTSTGITSSTFGRDNKNLGWCSDVTGRNNTVETAKIDGDGNITSNKYVTIEGYANKNAGGSINHLEGVLNNIGTAEDSHIEGRENNMTDGRTNHIEGRTNGIDYFARNTHIEGLENKVTGIGFPNDPSAVDSSHIEGKQNTLLLGNVTHIEGKENVNSHGNLNHIEGKLNTNDLGDNNHIEGLSNTNETGETVHIEGELNVVKKGARNHVEGYHNEVSSKNSHVSGLYNVARYYDDNGEAVSGLTLTGNRNIGNGSYQFVAGKYNTPISDRARITGGGSSSSDRKNIEELDWQGNLTLAGNVNAIGALFTQGIHTYDEVRSGAGFYTEGNITLEGGYIQGAGAITAESLTVTGNSVFGTGHNVSSADTQVEGKNNTVTSATGVNHVEGYMNKVSAKYSHVQGVANEVLNDVYRVHVEGWHNIANANDQHVAGKYNKTNANAVRITGWGTSDSNRKNIEELDQSGNAWFAGKITSGASAKEVILDGDTVIFACGDSKTNI